jgi:hypothetical protein
MKIVAMDTYPLVLPVREIYGGAAGFLEDCRYLFNQSWKPTLAPD